MYDKLCDNLDNLMTEARLSASELARCTGIPASTIKKIRNRDKPNPTLTTLLPIASHFNINLSQLLGEIPMTLTEQEMRPALYYLPIITWQEALTWHTHPSLKSDVIVTEREFSDAAFALRIEADDYPNFAKGSTLLIEPHLKPQPLDLVLVSSSKQTLPVLKQVLIEDGQLFLKSLKIVEQVVPLLPEYAILGIAVECRKSLR